MIRGIFIFIFYFFFFSAHGSAFHGPQTAGFPSGCRQRAKARLPIILRSSPVFRLVLDRRRHIADFPGMGARNVDLVSERWTVITGRPRLSFAAIREGNCAGELSTNSCHVLCELSSPRYSRTLVDSNQRSSCSQSFPPQTADPECHHDAEG